MQYLTLLIVAGCAIGLVWLLKQVHALTETVSKLQQDFIDVDYRLQRGWSFNAEKMRRLVKRLNKGEPLPSHCVIYKNIIANSR